MKFLSRAFLEVLQFEMHVTKGEEDREDEEEEEEKGTRKKTIATNRT